MTSTEYYQGLTITERHAWADGYFEQLACTGTYIASRLFMPARPVSVCLLMLAQLALPFVATSEAMQASGLTMTVCPSALQPANGSHYGSGLN